jgi:hypothetical protein
MHLHIYVDNQTYFHSKNISGEFIVFQVVWKVLVN